MVVAALNAHKSLEIIPHVSTEACAHLMRPHSIVPVSARPSCQQWEDNSVLNRLESSDVAAVGHAFSQSTTNEETYDHQNMCRSLSRIPERKPSHAPTKGGITGEKHVSTTFPFTNTVRTHLSADVRSLCYQMFRPFVARPLNRSLLAKSLGKRPKYYPSMHHGCYASVRNITHGHA